jgi:hypothetical protein
MPVRPVHHRRDAEAMGRFAHGSYLAHIGGADKPGDASVSSIVEVIKREGC